MLLPMKKAKFFLLKFIAGPVQEMEIYYQHEKLNMGWCIGCHREKGIAPPTDHYDTDYHKYDNSHPYEVKPRLTGGDCSKCHY